MNATTNSKKEPTPMTTPQCFTFTAEPVRIPVQGDREVYVRPTAPSRIGGLALAADHEHKLSRKEVSREGGFVVSAMNPVRPGTIQVRAAGLA
jgi:hypothetical protein